MDDAFMRSDVFGHDTDLEWDPSKRTPFDPFKDWGEKGIDWEIWKGRSFDEKRKPNYSEATGVHPLQKGVPKS